MNQNTNEKLRIVSLALLLPILLVSVLILLSQERPKGGEEHPTQASLPSESTAGNSQTGQKTICVITDSGEEQMKLEDYVLGAVLAEMPASFAEPALQAQAVASRTYGLKTTQDGTKHGQNRICTDATCCQSFVKPETFLARGESQAAFDKVRQAVQSTAGQVLAYHSLLIHATFFACSGGQTEDAVAVWGSVVPYLQSVPCDGEDETTAAYSDVRVFSPEEFQDALGVRLYGKVDSWFGQTTYTTGGGVEHMAIGGVLYRGTTLRSLLGLRSTAFEVSVSGGEIVISTRGFGHRVGMSQYGADAMAKQGSSFDEILKHFYQGVEIVQYQSLLE